MYSCVLNHCSSACLYLNITSWHGGLLFAEFDIFQMQKHGIQISIELIFFTSKIVSVFFWTWLEPRRTNPKWNEVTSHRTLTGFCWHQHLGSKKVLLLSRYTPPNILLIDFRESVSRRAHEVTNWLKQLILRARCPCSFWFGLLYFLLLRIMTRVEEWKISITQRESRRLLKFEKYNTGWLLRGDCAHLECN